MSVPAGISMMFFVSGFVSTGGSIFLGLFFEPLGLPRRRILLPPVVILRTSVEFRLGLVRKGCDSGLGLFFEPLGLPTDLLGCG